MLKETIETAVRMKVITGAQIKRCLLYTSPQGEENAEVLPVALGREVSVLKPEPI